MARLPGATAPLVTASHMSRSAGRGPWDNSLPMGLSVRGNKPLVMAAWQSRILHCQSALIAGQMPPYGLNNQKYEQRLLGLRRQI